MPEQDLEQTVPAAEEPANETIFSDVLDTAPYQKHIKAARIWLYVIAALQVGVGIYEYNVIDDPKLGLVAALIDGGIGAVFLLFAFFSYKRPLTSFTGALIAYVAVHVGLMIMDPTNIYKGIILKIIIVVALVRAVNNARDINKFQESVA